MRYIIKTVSYLLAALILVGAGKQSKKETTWIEQHLTKKKTLILEKTARQHLEKYQDPRTDLLFLFESNHPTCLQLMKELRLLDKKHSYPHSSWRLLEAKSSEQIIYEVIYPLSSFNTAHYQLHRLEKKQGRFHLLSYNINGKKPSKTRVNELIESLKQEAIT